jgi:hypothetical protein
VTHPAAGDRRPRARPRKHPAALAVGLARRLLLLAQMRLAAVACAAITALWAACAVESAPRDRDPDASDELIPFMAECPLGQHDRCETGLCFDFNMKGPHCTHECETDDDCEEPSTGCNGMGVCKAPGGDGGGGGGGG